MKLLAETAKLPPDRLTRLTRLRKLVSQETAVIAVELLELRHRARAKFRDAGRMLFTREGLEQSTGEAISQYRASRFPSGVDILDACCGIGGDAVSLAESGRVLAIDANPGAAVCAAWNTGLSSYFRSGRSAESLKIGGRGGVICGDVTKLNLGRLRRNGIKAAFFDPSRRANSASSGRRRVLSGEDYSPPLSYLKDLRAYFPDLCVKVSPTIDDAALTIAGCKTEFLSDRGECKEAALWFGQPGDSLEVPKSITPVQSSYFATVLRPDHPAAALTPFPCPPPGISEPLAWLYEPDPAVIRAHLVPQAASILNASYIDPQIPYLTSDSYTSTPFCTAYRTLEWMPFHLKSLLSRIRRLGRPVYAVKRRVVDVEPESLMKSFAQIVGKRPIVIVLTRQNHRTIAILCEMP